MRRVQMFASNSPAFDHGVPFDIHMGAAGIGFAGEERDCAAARGF